MTTLCDCNECKLVRLENETGRIARLERSHAWYVSQYDKIEEMLRDIHDRCPWCMGKLSLGGVHFNGCAWVRARDLAL